MQFNWIDWIIFFVVLYNVLDGWDKGLMSLLSSTIAFLASLWIAIRFHAQVGGFLVQTFGLPPLWINVLGYLVLAFPIEIMVNSMLERPLRNVPQKVVGSVVNRWFGSLLAVTNALLFLTFLFLVVLALPIRGTVKRDIKNSLVGSNLVLLSERFGGNVKSSFDSFTQEALKFVTIKPKSHESLDLDVAVDSSQLMVDAESEQRMVELVNKERVSQGLSALRVEEKLTIVARKHSRDMLERRYFSHYSPQGRDVGYRAREEGVAYTLIAENLAYSSDVPSVHTGFMNSEGHRSNILDSTLNRIGVGVIDANIFGKMFTQVFAD